MSQGDREGGGGENLIFAIFSVFLNKGGGVISHLGKWE